jgi:hypothetical protein
VVAAGLQGGGDTGGAAPCRVRRAGGADPKQLQLVGQARGDRDGAVGHHLETRTEPLPERDEAAAVRSERRVERTFGREPCDADGFVCGRRARDDEATVGLYRDGVGRAVSAGRDLEIAATIAEEDVDLAGLAGDASASLVRDGPGRADHAKALL